MAPAQGAWGRVCAGENVAEAFNDVRLEPTTFDLLPLFHFAHFPNLSQITSASALALDYRARERRNVSSQGTH
jgi:hypothetical protein